jgi:hypothetical protein
MAHFLKPKDERGVGYTARADGVLISAKIDGIGQDKRIVLWGGARGGEKLQFSGGGAYDAKGRLIARVVAGPVLETHSPDPDGDHLWYFLYRLKGVMEGVGTLTAADKAGMPFARLQITVGSGDIKVTAAPEKPARFEKKQENEALSSASFHQFKARSASSATKLSPAPCEATIMQLRLKVEKAGSMFWVAAYIPKDTTDFTRAYVFFHPNTIKPVDDPSYPSFTARWPTVEDHFDKLGVQLGSVLKMVLFVPFMRSTAIQNKASTNLFATRAVDTLNAMLEACAAAAGQKMEGSVTSVGVASFSSGIDHLVNFAASVRSAGIIKEQLDLDGPFTKIAHKTAPVLSGAVNVVISQVAAPKGAINWTQLPVPAWYDTARFKPNATTDPKAKAFAVHQEIGNFTFRAAMSESVFAPKP